jgi:AcrR family transcriptional regulator
MDTARFIPPQQARSQETLDRILDAVEEVLDEKSFGEATLVEIMERAGVTVGAFYRRFPDKDALLHLLDERFWDDMREVAAELLEPARWEGASIAEIMHEYLRVAVQIYRTRRGLMRSLFLRSRTDAVIRDTAHRVNATFLRRLRVLLLARSDEIRHPNPRYAIELGFLVLIGALREAILFSEVWPTARVGGARLPDELTRLFLAYLGIEEEGEGWRSGARRG